MHIHTDASGGILKLKNEADVLIAGIVMANNETLTAADSDFSDLDDAI